MRRLHETSAQIGVRIALLLLAALVLMAISVLAFPALALAVLGRDREAA